jgi:T4 superinfection immunity protein/zinc ribbon protein
MLIFALRFFPFFHFHPIFLVVSLFLYFLPTYLARNKSNFTAILVLNLLAGWTFIGWIVALVWALSSEPQRESAVPAQPVAASPPQSAGGGTFFCSTCGKPYAAGARFCSSCGATLPATQR